MSICSTCRYTVRVDIQWPNRHQQVLVTSPMQQVLVTSPTSARDVTNNSTWRHQHSTWRHLITSHQFRGSSCLSHLYCHLYPRLPPSGNDRERCCPENCYHVGYLHWRGYCHWISSCVRQTGRLVTLATFHCSFWFNGLGHQIISPDLCNLVLEQALMAELEECANLVLFFFKSARKWLIYCCEDSMKSYIQF